MVIRCHPPEIRVRGQGLHNPQGTDPSAQWSNCEAQRPLKVDGAFKTVASFWVWGGNLGAVLSGGKIHYAPYKWHWALTCPVAGQKARLTLCPRLYLPEHGWHLGAFNGKSCAV